MASEKYASDIKSVNRKFLYSSMCESEWTNDEKKFVTLSEG